MSFIFSLPKFIQVKTLVRIRNVYARPLKGDGRRILADRLWPRGLTKEDVAYDTWAKELAPSPGLRKWFGHTPDLWNDFQKYYRAELRKNKAVDSFVYEHKGDKVITLLYAARDKEHTHALVLQEYLQQQFNNL